VRAAIDAYHSLLTPERAQETHAHLIAQLQRRGLYFGERPLMNVLRPRFLAPDQYRFLQERSATLLRAFDKIYRAALADASFRSQFGLTDWEEALMAADPGLPEASPLSRLDGFFVHDRGGFKITEYNAETPAGAAYGDVLAELVLGLPVMRDFLRAFELRSLPTRHHVLHALLDSYAQFSGKSNAAPRMAIIDWPDVPTRHEFVLSVDYFASQGVSCIIADPRSAEYSGGRLMLEGQPVDLIYKRVLINELVDRCGIDHAIVRAVRDRAVCMVNPFRCKILHKKMSLAVLSDPSNHWLLDAAETSCIELHVPWTRRVAELKTKYHDDVVDLLPFVADHKDRFVLKPNDEYGGTGIVLGWLASAEAWQAGLRAALEEPFIVQERIELPVEKYPVLLNGELRIEDRIEDVAPFCFHGAYMDGMMSRLSTESLVNVTAGGGSSVPTFIVTPR
jgi:hypothetical protein